MSEQKASEVMPEFAGEPQVTRARDRRATNSFVAVINKNLVVRVRKVDIFTMIMTGTAPFNLLEAAREFEKMERKFLDGAANPLQAFESLSTMKPEEMAKAIEWLRYYACTCVVDPRIVPEDKGDPDTLPVIELSTEELLGIFYARENTKEVPLVDKDTAADFRRSESDDVAPDGPPSAEIPPAPKLLDYGDREGISW